MLARRFTSRSKTIVSSISTLSAMAWIVYSTFVSPTYEVRPDYDNMVVIGFIIGLFPPAFVDLIDRRWRLAIDRKIPEMLRDLTENLKTGVTFAKGLESLAETNYGPLTKELRKTMLLMRLGYTYEEALDALAGHVDTPLMRRTVTILSEIGKSGGKIHEILEGVYSHVREIQELEKERSRQLLPYTMIIYAAFFTYIAVVVILFRTFFSQVSMLIEAGAPFGAGVNPDLFFIWFFHLAIIQSVIGGFVAGKIGEGAMTAGLKHVLLLFIVSLVVFTFLVRI